MFTGIIEEMGTVKALRTGASSSILTISGNEIFDDLRLGDSVAVNGVCLTVSDLSHKSFTADVMQETLSRSTLGILKNGGHVNLERAMAANGRFGGHIVSGHIDGTGEITEIRRNGNALWYTISTGEKLMRYIVEKGSIAIDGISLTVARVSLRDFSVSIIPHTFGNTTLSGKRIGHPVNLENDLVGKYIEKLLKTPSTEKINSNITPEFLGKFGF